MSEGYYFGYSACATCGEPFPYNPKYVPSYDFGHGKEPICPKCMEAINRRRVEEHGLPPHPIHPRAYQPQPENE